MSKNKYIIILVGLLDVLSIWMVVPTLPDLMKYYHVWALLISYWVTAYMFFSFLAAPFLWQLSDIFWRRKILTICVGGSFFSSLVIALWTTYPAFIIWRIINGITGWNISILQAMMSDISKDKDELRENIWTISTLVWAGFIIGPLFWAILLHYWIKVPYWFMTVFSLIETVILIIFLDETHKNPTKKKIQYNPFKQIIHYLKNPAINLFMISLFLTLLSYFLYQSVLPLYLNKHYMMNWAATWYVMAWLGINMFLSRMFLVNKFWFKYFSLHKVLYIINITGFILLLSLFFVKSLALFLILLFLLVGFMTIVNPTYQAEIIDKVEGHSRWAIIWVLFSIQSIVMFLWPLFGWYFLEKNIPIFLLSAFIIFLSIIIVTKIVKVQEII